MEKLEIIKIKVFIVDDHPVVRFGISQAINQETDMGVCGDSGELDHAKAEIQRLSPDIVLLDISLKNDNGINLIHDLASTNPGLPVLALTMHDEQIYVKCSLEAGAKGYFHKDDSIKNIPIAIRTIISGESYFSKNILNTLCQTFANHSDHDDSIEKLSPREMEIFRLLGERKRRHHIAEQLFVTPKTVSAHIENIKTKLNISTSDEVTEYAVWWIRQNFR
ncbi:MAG: DNA-binding response regulator [Candidatus Omnitrophota bacterium]|jgi:DNA-binding NarL/FixJ family response regulator|nr:MAG: DNA-binding response regulator [Candidatus Omnitrophota bacterium]